MEEDSQTSKSAWHKSAWHNGHNRFNLSWSFLYIPADCCESNIQTLTLTIEQQHGTSKGLMPLGALWMPGPGWPGIYNPNQSRNTQFHPTKNETLPRSQDCRFSHFLTLPNDFSTSIPTNPLGPLHSPARSDENGSDHQRAKHGEANSRQDGKEDTLHREPGSRRSLVSCSMTVTIIELFLHLCAKSSNKWRLTKKSARVLVIYIRSMHRF